MDQLSKCHDAPCKPPQWPVPYARHAAIERLLGIQTLDGSKADPPCPLIYRASSYHGLLLCAGQITIGCKASNTISTVYAVRHQPPSAQNRLLGTNHPQHQIPTALCVCVCVGSCGNHLLLLSLLPACPCIAGHLVGAPVGPVLQLKELGAGIRPASKSVSSTCFIGPHTLMILILHRSSSSYTNLCHLPPLALPRCCFCPS